MAQFDVTLSRMTETANNMRTHCEDYRAAADELKNITENLTSASGGWDAVSSRKFNENIAQFHGWMTEMGALGDEYAVAVEKARELYENADISAAKQFRG